MTDNETTITSIINKMVIINARLSKVWIALTDPQLMKQWMSETDIEIITDWQIGNPMIIRGDWYKTGFENKGAVLQFEPERILQYTHLSSLSRLPDTSGNYSTIKFKLTPEDDQTILDLTVSNFPTEVIYKHLVFYWSVTIELFKKFVEQL